MPLIVSRSDSRPQSTNTLLFMLYSMLTLTLHYVMTFRGN